jgi:hypothetical protein
MTATRLYTRAYITRTRSRAQEPQLDDLSKIEIKIKPKAHAR